MSNTAQKLQELQQNELMQAALKKALLWLGEPENATVQILHKGGQGAIFRAESPKYPYPLSIKTPLFNDKYTVEEFQELLRTDWEIQSLGAKTDHTLFPELVYCDPEGDFLIRQYVEGQELHSAIKTASPQERLELFLKATELTAKVFHAFHDAPPKCYLLRDYRPKNILVENKSHRLYLIDCGSTEVEETNQKKKEKKNLSRLGDGGYESWAPERLLDNRELVDRRIDFYSYGVMSYRILYNKFAYSNEISDPEEAWKVFHQEYHTAEATIRADERLKQIRPELVEQLIGCLHPDAHKRFCGKLITP